MDPDELYALLQVDVALLAQQPIRGKGIILFDDVLTTGKHFRAGVRRLREVVPATTEIVGMFVARRVIDVSADFEDSTL
jgi:pyrimidine operon attenuation protein/uracil phosphoribosyltransferase